MNKSKLSYFILRLAFILIVLMPSNLYAGEGDAGQPGEFLRYGVGVRSLGLGRAFVGLADDASAIYYNPAGLMGLEKKEFYLMSFKLFNESRYSYFALALPRVDRTKEKIWKYLFGPDVSWGFAWVNLSTEDLERRDSEDRKIGDFDIYQQAFLIGYARELCGTWGILDYGTTIKFINQGLSYSNSHWGWGMDLGVKVQLLNPKIIKEIVSLKYLLPFQLGLSLQNFIPPEVSLENATEKYQPLLKVGGSYRVDLKDDLKLLLANDLDWLLDTKRDMGIYEGIELQYLYRGSLISPRIGYNNQARRVTFGLGLKSNIAKSWDLQFDYAYGIHEDLMDDHRISLTFNFGRLFDANYFSPKSVGNNPSPDIRKKHLQVVARYPYDYDKADTTMEKIEKSAIELATIYDPGNAERYYELIRGLGLANWRFREAKALLKKNENKEAKSKAEKSITEYESCQKNNKISNNEDFLNFAEAYMIVDKWDSAAKVMEENVVTSSLRYLYQRGICYKNLGMFDDAIKDFTGAIKLEQDSMSMRALSLLGLGECLMEKEQPDPDEAIRTFEKITKEFSAPLEDDYPRYPTFQDKNIADDAQYLLGECYEKLAEKAEDSESKKALEKEALTEYAKVCRFYPNWDKCKDAEEKLKELIENK